MQLHFLILALQIDLSSLQQQLDIVRTATESSITPSLDALSQLLGRRSEPGAAEAATRMVAEAVAGRSTAGAWLVSLQWKIGRGFLLREKVVNKAGSVYPP